MTGYRIVSALAESDEDSWEHGITGKHGACWDVQLRGNGGDLFETIGKALEHVCKSLCFEYVPENWDWDGHNGQFYSDFVVNDDNEELTEKYDKGMLDRWRKGEFNLWDCRVTVEVVKCVETGVSDEDVEAFRKECREYKESSNE